MSFSTRIGNTDGSSYIWTLSNLIPNVDKEYTNRLGVDFGFENDRTNKWINRQFVEIPATISKRCINKRYSRFEVLIGITEIILFQR